MRAVFIGGISHSGTSILRKCLKEHPQVTGMEGELRIICDPDGLADAIDDLSDRWTRHRGDRAVARLRKIFRLASGRQKQGAYKDTNLEQWLSPNYRKKYKKLISAITDEEVRTLHRGFESSINGTAYMTHQWSRGTLARQFGMFVESLYKDRDQNATHFVEDTPENLAHFNTLRLMFDDMRFIHIVRHPMDVMHSLWNTGNTYGENDTISLARRNRNRMMRWWAQRDSISPFSQNKLYQEIRFEDFVQNHEQTLRMLCDYIGVDWTDEMLDNRMDPERAHIGRYDDAKFKDEAIIQEILAPVAWEYNYEW